MVSRRMASVRSGTGDIKNNLMKLLREIQRMKLQIEPNIQGLSLGAPSAFLPVLHESLMHYSLPFANWLTRHDYELYGKNDLRFLEGLYKALRDVFHYHPQLTREQFLSTGFAERKILLTIDVLCFCQAKHHELTGRRGGRRRISASSKARTTRTEVLTVRDTSGISSTWSEATTVDVQGPDSALDDMHPNYPPFTPPPSPEHLRPAHPPSSTPTTLTPTLTPIKDLELTPAPTPLKLTSASRAPVNSVTTKQFGSSRTPLTSERAPASEHPLHGQPRPQPAGISPTGTAAIARHFPVSDCSDQSNDLHHLLSLRGYRNKTAATSVPPHTQLPVTSHLTSESTHRAVSETRDAAGSGELEKGGMERGGRRGGGGGGGRGERGEGGGEGSSRESSPESWHSLAPHEGEEEEEGIPIQQVKEAAGEEDEVRGIQDGKFQPSLKDISSHMEQLTHLVERMSARFVILETQLKLVEPQEQKAPPSSLTGNTTWTTLPLSENHGMKMVTVAERAASPLHYDKNTGSQPPPPLLAPSQTDTETPAKMRSILKHPSSCHVAAGRELLPPCPSPTSSRHMASATPLNSWAACSPLNWSPYSKSNDQRSREIQSPSKCIYPRSPAKPWSVYQATGGLHSTPTTPDDTKKMIENLRNRARRTKDFLQKVNSQNPRTQD